VAGGAVSAKRNEGASIDLQNVEKKLREVRFFYERMIDQESRAFGDKEPFDFFLSAFLSASKTVDYRLRHEHDAAYQPWREKWNSTLTAQEARLIEFMVDHRNLDVHESGTGHGVKNEKIAVSGTYADKSGTVTISAPPLVLGGPQQNPSAAFVIKPTYNFTVDGVERKATEACGEYLVLLERMLKKFEADCDHKIFGIGWVLKAVFGPDGAFQLWDIFISDQWVGSRRTEKQCHVVIRNAGVK
jgi:hypothetical protein